MKKLSRSLSQSRKVPRAKDTDGSHFDHSAKIKIGDAKVCKSEIILD